MKKLFLSMGLLLNALNLNAAAEDIKGLYGAKNNAVKAYVENKTPNNIIYFPVLGQDHSPVFDPIELAPGQKGVLVNLKGGDLPVIYLNEEKMLSRDALVNRSWTSYPRLELHHSPTSPHLEDNATIIIQESNQPEKQHEEELYEIDLVLPAKGSYRIGYFSEK